MRLAPECSYDSK